MGAVYEWKFLNYFPVAAQVAGETIEGLKASLGKENIEPKDLLEASRAEDAPLHVCFEWDDSVAAEKYRFKQAGDIIRGILVTTAGANDKPLFPRAFINVSSNPRGQGTFVSLEAAMTNETYRRNALHNALFELRKFQKTYEVYQELADVFKAIDDFAAAIK